MLWTWSSVISGMNRDLLLWKVLITILSVSDKEIPFCIVFSKRKKFLEVKFQVSEAKLKAFSEEVNVAELKDYLKSWQLISKGDKDGGKIASLEMPYRFRWLTAARSTIIQSSRPHPGLCEDPQEVLNDLFDKYVK